MKEFKVHGVVPAIRLGALAVALMAMTALSWADAVDDVLSRNLDWRTTNQVSKSKLRLVGGDGAPVGWYYLDLRSGSPGEVSIMNYNLGKTNLVARTVRAPDRAYMFYNEDVYVLLDAAKLQALGSQGLDFWTADTVAEARAALSSLLTITGTTTKTVDGVTYDGIEMSLSAADWDAYRASIDNTLIVNLPQDTFTQITLYFDPQGRLHSIESTGVGVNAELLFYDWTNLSGNLTEMQDARREPHAGQEQWDMPLDEATLKYIAQITR